MDLDGTLKAQVLKYKVYLHKATVKISKIGKPSPKAQNRQQDLSKYSRWAQKPLDHESLELWGSRTLG